MAGKSSLTMTHGLGDGGGVGGVGAGGRSSAGATGGGTW